MQDPRFSENVYAQGDGFVGVGPQLELRKPKFGPLFSWDLDRAQAHEHVEALKFPMIKKTVELLKENGIQPILVIPPDSGLDPVFATLGVPTIALNQTDKYPLLYHADFHSDPFHLNPAGSTLFSQALADEFARLVYR
jgi:hypothetical protein